MENQELRQLILRELPGILEHDPQVQELVLRLARQHFADKAETESRFDRILDELRRDREEQHARWVGQDVKWADQNAKWEENQKTVREILDSIQALIRKHDSTIGALGARWGLSAEQSFCNALRGILDDAFGVQTVNVTEYDDEGQVFGRPDEASIIRCWAASQGRLIAGGV